MTKKEAVFATCQASVSDNSVILAMLNNGFVDGDIDQGYTAADIKAVELSAIECLTGLLASPDVSEGNYSVKYDRRAVQSRILFLAKKYGLTDVISQVTPTVKGASVW